MVGVVLAVIMLLLMGCAKPVPFAANVVRDADVQGCMPSSVAFPNGLDVAIIIDTSQSTRRPSGIDVDRDGLIPVFRGNSTVERGDSRLAAQIAGLRPLVEAAAGHDIRFSVVTYAGASGLRTTGKAANSGTSAESQTRSRLTKDTRRLDRILADVLSRGSNGSTVFFAGMQQGSRSLLSGMDRGRRRIALLLSDASRPTGIDSDTKLSPVQPGMRFGADPRMKKAAILAKKRQIVFHTFGLSPDSGAWRHHAIGQIAGATGGSYHAVEDPSAIFCHLADALVPASRESELDRAFARARRSAATTQAQ